ncbi:tyrosine protein phosphatase [Phellopilus nigrolimitatus]|nr:tyrosine protein phosphatase [Phellopilus nigrolimitatus]
MAPKCEPLCHFNDRLYFTTFPQPAPAPHTLNRPSAERGSPPAVRPRSNNFGSPVTPDEDATYYYFTIDHQLLYLSFFKDWGPLNLAMVYKACILIHELLEDEELKSYRLVLYSSDDPRRKANAALLMALYVMIVQKRAPWEAFQPVAELEFMSFRDAGRGFSDFNLSIQDCLWGMWKAMQNGLCDMNEFNVDDYEYFEKVENGDWNWITPSFIAFASPVEHAWTKKTSPTSARKLPTSFQNCLDYFEGHGVKLVVRLNNVLYDRQHFIDHGIRHEEMYFDDGTNPTDEIVRKFINLADEVIEAGGAIAIHCKAGLGRTGTLIGAYLIWKYGFTAHEAIAFMRIVRPGSVVGPQQQYMYVKQMEWAKWAAVDEMRRAEAQTAAAIAAASVRTPATPPAEVDEEERMEVGASVETVAAAVAVIPPSTPKSKAIPPVTPSKHVSAATARARGISPPGQPRKTPVAKRTATAAAVDESEEESEEDELNALPVIGTRARAKTQSTVPTRTTGGRRVLPASEQRPTRVTRSTAAAIAGNVRRPAGAAATGPTSPSKGAGNGPSPNKIPRLAQAPPSPPARSTTSMGTRARLQAPTPSRLPTLAMNRRGNAAGGPAEAGGKAGEKGRAGQASDAWMKTNPSAVVVPGTKLERPGLRSVRRRRSSFSAADVVA